MMGQHVQPCPDLIFSHSSNFSCCHFLPPRLALPSPFDFGLATLGAGGPSVLSLPELPPSSSVSERLLLLLLVLEELDLLSTLPVRSLLQKMWTYLGLGPVISHYTFLVLYQKMIYCRNMQWGTSPLPPWLAGLGLAIFCWLPGQAAKFGMNTHALLVLPRTGPEDGAPPVSMGLPP